MADTLTPVRSAAMADIINQLFGAGTVEAPAPRRAAVASAPAEAPTTYNLTLHGDEIWVDFPYSQALVAEVRNVEGRRWDGTNKVNRCAVSMSALEFAERHNLTVEPAVSQAVAHLKVDYERQLEMAKASRATDFEDLDVSGIALTDIMKPYQVAGVSYCLRLESMRAIIADQQGLGKTLQSMAVVESVKRYPVVVVCKSNLRGNWVREYDKFLSGRKVQALYGTRPYDIDTDTEVVVVGYDILDAWLSELMGILPQALIVDESHYVKNPQAKRSKAIVALAEMIPAGQPVLFLTGTPTLNRGVELINQLRALGIFEQVAPKPRRASGPGGTYTDKDWEFSFKFRYCDPQRTKSGHWEFKGTSNELELHEKMRRIGYVRRERKEVLGTKDTFRVRTDITLNGELKEYRQAEADFMNYLASTRGEDAADRAASAEELAKLSVLRELLGRAKVTVAIDWIEDWLDQNPDQKLVVWGWHRAVQEAIVAHFDCPSLLGGEKDPEGQKELFMEGDARVLVCSLQASAEGHTLTAASNTVFVEQPWTPGAVDQAEDRVNRIGQTADVCSAWTLVANAALDQWLFELIEEKRANTDAINKGIAKPNSTSTFDAESALINALAHKAA